MPGREPEPRWVRRDGHWVAAAGSYDEARRRYRDVILKDEHGRKVGRHDRPGAYLALARLRRERAEAERRATGPTAADVIAAYLDWQRARGAKPNTLEDHAYHLERFGLFAWQGVPYCDRAAASIGVRDLARVRAAMEARGNQPGYIRHLYSSVLACWRWACRPVEGRDPERLLGENPFEGLERPRAGRGKKAALPWELIRQLLDFAESRAVRCYGPTRARSRLRALALRLVAESGCRPKEAMDTEWGWVCEDARAIIIPWQHHKTGWRDRQDRFIVLTRALADRLRELRTSGESHERWVFGAAGDARVSPPSSRSFGKYFQELRERAVASGLRLPPGTTLYTLRRSLVTAARQGGVDFAEMALPMGHSGEVARAIYHQPDVDAARAAFDRMDAARRGESGGE